MNTENFAKLGREEALSITEIVKDVETDIKERSKENCGGKVSEWNHYVYKGVEESNSNNYLVRINDNNFIEVDLKRCLGSGITTRLSCEEISKRIEGCFEDVQGFCSVCNEIKSGNECTEGECTKKVEKGIPSIFTPLESFMETYKISILSDDYTIKDIERIKNIDKYIEDKYFCEEVVAATYFFQLTNEKFKEYDVEFKDNCFFKVSIPVKSIDCNSFRKNVRIIRDYLNEFSDCCSEKIKGNKVLKMLKDKRSVISEKDFKDMKLFIEDEDFCSIGDIENVRDICEFIENCIRKKYDLHIYEYVFDENMKSYRPYFLKIGDKHYIDISGLNIYFSGSSICESTKKPFDEAFPEVFDETSKKIKEMINTLKEILGSGDIKEKLKKLENKGLKKSEESDSVEYIFNKEYDETLENLREFQLRFDGKPICNIRDIENNTFKVQDFIKENISYCFRYTRSPKSPCSPFSKYRLIHIKDKKYIGIFDMIYDYCKLEEIDNMKKDFDLLNEAISSDIKKFTPKILSSNSDEFVPSCLKSENEIIELDEYKKRKINFYGRPFLSVGEVMDKSKDDILKCIKEFNNEPWYYCNLSPKCDPIDYSRKILVNICDNYYVEVRYRESMSGDAGFIVKYFDELRNGIISKIEEISKKCNNREKTGKIEGFEERTDSLELLECPIVGKDKFYKEEGVRLFNMFHCVYTMGHIRDGRYHESYIRPTGILGY